MLTVGLTGGIGSGKSEVAAVLQDLGCQLFHADRIAHDLLSPGTDLLRRVTDLFGREILRDDGELDRQTLGHLVFNDAGKLRLLNREVHPAVIAEEERLLRDLEREAAGGPCIAVVEAALMVEAGTHSRYQRLVVVHCTVEQQLERLTAARGLSREEAEQRIANQLPSRRKLDLAHYTIDSSGRLDETRQRAKELFRCLARDEREQREGH